MVKPRNRSDYLYPRFPLQSQSLSTTANFSRYSSNFFKKSDIFTWFSSFPSCPSWRSISMSNISSDAFSSFLEKYGLLSKSWTKISWRASFLSDFRLEVNLFLSSLRTFNVFFSSSYILFLSAKICLLAWHYYGLLSLLYHIHIIFAKIYIITLFTFFFNHLSISK